MTHASMPRIYVYQCDDAPASNRFLGAFFMGSARLPVIFNSPEREALIASMRDFWAEEQAKRERAEARRVAMAERRRKELQ